MTWPTASSMPPSPSLTSAALTADLIAALPALQMVAVAATGYNNIDLDACRARSIVVSNVRGYARDTVPEHVFALLAGAHPADRALPLGGRRALADERAVLLVSTTRSATSPTASWASSAAAPSARASRIAEAFGMTVLRGEHKGAAAVREGYLPFEQLIGEADVISLTAAHRVHPATSSAPVSSPR